MADLKGNELGRKTFFIFRHGETKQSLAGNLHYGEEFLTAPLLPQGEEQAVRIGQFLKTVGKGKFYCSTLMRCRETAKIISGITGCDFVYDHRLDEFGEKGSEPFENFRERIKDFLDGAGLEKEKVIVVCTHGAVLAGIKQFLLTGDFKREGITDYPQPGVIWKIRNGSLKSVDLR